MKWIFMTLLLVNLAFFAWSYPSLTNQSEPERDPPGVERLMLLSEYQAQQAELTAVEAEPEMAEEKPMQPAETAEPKADQEPESDVEAQTQADEVPLILEDEPVIEQEAEVIDLADQPAVADEIPEPQSKPGSEPDFEGQVAMLTDTDLEQETTRITDEIDLEPAVEEAEPVEQPLIKCYRYGPLEKRAES